MSEEIKHQVVSKQVWLIGCGILVGIYKILFFYLSWVCANDNVCTFFGEYSSREHVNYACVCSLRSFNNNPCGRCQCYSLDVDLVAVLFIFLIFFFISSVVAVVVAVFVLFHWTWGILLRPQIDLNAYWIHAYDLHSDCVVCNFAPIDYRTQTTIYQLFQLISDIEPLDVLIIAVYYLKISIKWKFHW